MCPSRSRGHLYYILTNRVLGQEEDQILKVRSKNCVVYFAGLSVHLELGDEAEFDAQSTPWHQRLPLGPRTADHRIICAGLKVLAGCFSYNTEYLHSPPPGAGRAVAEDRPEGRPRRVWQAGRRTSTAPGANLDCLMCKLRRRTSRHQTGCHGPWLMTPMARVRAYT